MRSLLKSEKENYSVGKCCQNGEKAIESRLTKKLDSLIEILVKKHQLKRIYTHPHGLIAH